MGPGPPCASAILPRSKRLHALGAFARRRLLPSRAGGTARRRRARIRSPFGPLRGRRSSPSRSVQPPAPPARATPCSLLTQDDEANFHETGLRAQTFEHVPVERAVER